MLDTGYLIKASGQDERRMAGLTVGAGTWELATETETAWSLLAMNLESAAQESKTTHSF